MQSLDKKDRYSMFQICTMEDKTSIYYDYKEKKYYQSNQSVNQLDRERNSWYFLGVPIALAFCYAINAFFQRCDRVTFCLVMLGFLVGIGVLVQLLFGRLYRQGREQMRWNLRELPNVEKEQEMSYKLLAKKQLKKQLYVVGILGLGLAGLLLAFIHWRNIVILLVYAVVYLIEYLICRGVCPIRKITFLH